MFKFNGTIFLLFLGVEIPFSHFSRLTKPTTRLVPTLAPNTVHQTTHVNIIMNLHITIQLEGRMKVKIFFLIHTLGFTDVKNFSTISRR